MKTRSQQTFIIPDRHMLSEHAVESSLLVFDNTIQDDPRQNREEIRLLGIVGNAHAQINQLKNTTATAQYIKIPSAPYYSVTLRKV